MPPAPYAFCMIGFATASSSFWCSSYSSLVASALASSHLLSSVRQWLASTRRGRKGTHEMVSVMALSRAALSSASSFSLRSPSTELRRL